MSGPVTVRDREAVESFHNFLSWGEIPALPSDATARRVYRSVPPAWWAYSFGFTRYCPPKGTL